MDAIGKGIFAASIVGAAAVLTITRNDAEWMWWMWLVVLALLLYGGKNR